MREQTRVVVTGLGVVSPLGPLPAFWDRLCAGVDGIVPIADFDPGPEPSHLAARVRDWEPRDHVPPKVLRRMDRCSRMVVSACRMALANANLTLEGGAAEEAGVVVGTAYGNVAESEQFVRGLVAKGPGLANPLTFPNTVLNAAAGYVAIDLGLRGPNLTVTRGEASGEGALALAYDTIVTGQADVLLAGGVDEVAPVLFQIYKDLGLLSPCQGARRRVPGTCAPAGPAREWSSPFDRDRNGLVMGEGAAMLVLERAEHAAARGAAVYAELVGHASETVAASVHDWPPPGAAHPVETARQLSALGWQPARDATLILSAANSTPRLDAFEAAALGALLGEARRRAVVTSLRGALGDFGGVGAFGGVAACLALRTAAFPRLGALRAPDPACGDLPLATVTAAAPTGGFDAALVTATPRGGACLALLFRRA